MYFKFLFLSLLTNFIFDLPNQICQFIQKSINLGCMLLFLLWFMRFEKNKTAIVISNFSNHNKNWDISANRKQPFLKRIQILKMRAAKHMRAQTTLSVTCLSPLLLPSRPTRRMQFIKTNVLETILKFQQSENLDETKKSRNFKDSKYL